MGHRHTRVNSRPAVDEVTQAPITGRTRETGQRWLPEVSETIVVYDDDAGR